MTRVHQRLARLGTHIDINQGLPREDDDLKIAAASEAAMESWLTPERACATLPESSRVLTKSSDDTSATPRLAAQSSQQTLHLHARRSLCGLGRALQRPTASRRPGVHRCGGIGCKDKHLRRRLRRDLQRVLREPSTLVLDSAMHTRHRD